MSPRRDIRDGVRRLFALAVRQPGRAASDADAELESVIEEHVAYLVARGADPAVARAEAVRALGGTLDAARDKVRESAGRRERRLSWAEWMDDAKSDARYALRTLRRSPALAGTAVATLALAIGANTAIFSAVSAVMLRPLPFREPASLVMLWETNPDFHWTQAEAAPANLLDWKQQVGAFEDVGGFFSFGFTTTLTGYGEPRLLKSRGVTGNFFGVVGVRAERGRTLTMDETWDGGAPRPVVLSYRAWRDVFGADTSIVGRAVQLDGRAVEVAGVLPERFRVPGVEADLWTSVSWTQAFRGNVSFRRAHFVRAVGRLKRGVTAERANAELQTVVTRLQREYPATNAKMGAGMTPLHEFLVGNTKLPLLVMFGAVGALLLIACANVANLLLVRAAGREREVALRLALGAGRGRLLRQAFTESCVLAALGGAAGLALGWWGTRALVVLQPPGMLPVTDVAMSWTVLAYVTLATAGSALVFGIAPALWTGRRVPADVLKEDSRSSIGSLGARRWGDVLLVGEVALALTLALGAGLLVRSYALLRNVDAGFESKGVLAVSLSLPGIRYDSARKVTGFFDELERRTAALPGVEAAAVVSQIPLTSPPWSSQFSVQGRGPIEDASGVWHREITPRYQRVMRVPVRSGRLLEETDAAAAPMVVLINDALARRFFPRENPVGLRVSFDRTPDSTATWRTIVGVVGDERIGAINEDAKPEFIAPLPQELRRGMTMVVRTSGDPAALGPSVRRIIGELDPALAISELRTMDDVRAAALSRDRFLTTLMLAFAGVGVALALVGVYGVVAQLARRRMREMGIRIALGARAGQVQWIVVRHGLGLTALGAVAGVTLALGGGRLIRTLLYQVTPGDPVTFLLVPALVLLTAALASWLPARRAGRADPADVLRAD